MEVKMAEELCRAVGVDRLKNYGLSDADYHFRYKKFLTVPLNKLAKKQVEQLVEMVLPHDKKKTGSVVLRDLRTWLAMMRGSASITARTVEKFAVLLKAYLQDVPGHRVYKKDADKGVWQAYYVSGITYHKPERHLDDYTPAYVSVDLRYREFMSSESSRESFNASACVGLTVEQALRRREIMVETKELREEYLARRAKFDALVPKVGKQCLARGEGSDDCDGNSKKRDDDDGYWWRSRTNRVQLDKDGEASRVVVDVFHENKQEDDEDDGVDGSFWDDPAAPTKKVNLSDRRRDLDDDDLDDDAEADPDEAQERIAAVEVPVHPTLAVFDLRRQLRLRVDVGQLEEYEYDQNLGEKLILPENSRKLIDMLLAHKGAFNDIVQGKSGGTIVLCAGIAGTGKTLTAEVYSEVVARPLYTVQASQLGLTAEDLEDELLKVFARSLRWNAILLIDEADVYISERGKSLVQNAIVGVFLRVLEYYRGVLFLTTNRAELVDDAVASRCIARINYSYPDSVDQQKIWYILAKSGGLEISKATIAELSKKYPRLTGRDVKNLLKLAKLVASVQEKTAITAAMIEFVKHFKPTEEAK